MRRLLFLILIFVVAETGMAQNPDWLRGRTLQKSQPAS